MKSLGEHSITRTSPTVQAESIINDAIRCRAGRRIAGPPRANYLNWNFA